MATTITLAADGKRLCLIPNEEGWCQVLLEDGSRQIPLGADALSIIGERLGEALEREAPDPSIGFLEGREVWWALSLQEVHTTFYVARSPGSRTLFLQNAQAEPIGVLTLTEAERQEWLTSLAAQREQSLTPTSG